MEELWVKILQQKKGKFGGIIQVLEVILILVAALLFWAAISDFRTRTIPNWISLSIVALFLAFIGGQFFLGTDPVVVPPLISLATGLVSFVVFAAFFYFGFLGGGDVKLISALALWAGWPKIIGFILFMAIAGGVLAVFYIFRREKTEDFEVDSEALFVKAQEKDKKIEVKALKNKKKSDKIPYGIAISVGGLFTVNQIFMNLIA
jgi:prepilin peptidase CpaA